MEPIESRELIRLAIPCDPVAPRVARAAIRGVAEIEAVREDVLLVVSELVTHAVVHSDCDPRDTIAVRAVLTGSCVRITVHDSGPTDAPTIPAEDPRQRGGLGLRIVERIARRWGVYAGHGRVVWAELAL